MVTVIKKALHKAYIFFARLVFETTCTVVGIRARLIIAGLVSIPCALVVVTSGFNHHAAVAENAAGRNDGCLTGIDRADVCIQLIGAV